MFFCRNSEKKVKTPKRSSNLKKCVFSFLVRFFYYVQHFVDMSARVKMQTFLHFCLLFLHLLLKVFIFVFFLNAAQRAVCYLLEDVKKPRFQSAVF